MIESNKLRQSYFIWPFNSNLFRTKSETPRAYKIKPLYVIIFLKLSFIAIVSFTGNILASHNFDIMASLLKRNLPVMQSQMTRAFTTQFLSPYPKSPINRQGFINVSPLHQIYFEESGNPSGFPIVYLHGGPGYGCTEYSRSFFDPKFYRIIAFDQRGSGRSRPYAEIKNNTTNDLVRDIETIRNHLNIPKWLVFGGSWGSLLTLVYAIHYPDNCNGLILLGTQLGKREEINWFMKGAGTFFPKQWQNLRDFISPNINDPQELLKAYHSLLVNPDEAIHLPAARSLCSYGGSIASIYKNSQTTQGNTDNDRVLALARISTHYWTNDFFLNPNFVAENRNVLKMPCIILQGQCDFITPPASSFELSQMLEHAQYVVIPNSGHSSQEPPVLDAILKATDTMKGLFADYNSVK